MFINFQILVDSHERDVIDLQVTTPKEALGLIFLFETSPRVIAWQMPGRDPGDFGAAPGSSPIWKKFRMNGFSREDYL